MERRLSRWTCLGAAEAISAAIAVPVLCLCLCLAGFACAYQYVCACACVPLGEDGFGRGGKDKKRFRPALGCIGPGYYYYYQAGHCMSRPPAVLFSGL